MTPVKSTSAPYVEDLFMFGFSHIHEEVRQCLVSKHFVNPAVLR